ncbi:uncharacterized protein LOC118458696 [Anopheles albimanus]|uniref:Uncharacterized protein n=1 Tax=Anopheles albimanus TaxID=7167 RepID=A0A182FR09_ANOAL|nr:uncharacterized protein LOC118458696 [Anopheles albimanus]
MLPYLAAIRCTGITVFALLVLNHAVTAEKYEVHLDKLERLDSDGDYFTYNYTFEKVSELKISFSANIHQHKELDDSYTIKAMIARAELAEDSEYEVMIDLRKPLCDWMRTMYKTYFYDELKPVSNMPPPETCPLPVADYWMKDYVFDAEPYQEMMTEGRWKTEMMLLKGDEVCAGIIMLSTVKPAS